MPISASECIPFSIFLSFAECTSKSLYCYFIIGDTARWRIIKCTFSARPGTSEVTRKNPQQNGDRFKLNAYVQFILRHPSNTGAQEHAKRTYPGIYSRAESLYPLSSSLPIPRCCTRRKLIEQIRYCVY